MDVTNTSVLSPDGQNTGSVLGEKAGASHAPTYTIPRRRFGAVEHPMIIKDIDKGIATFGRGHSVQSVRTFP
jgi:hypothetical protein